MDSDSKTATDRLRELLDEGGVEWRGFWVKTMQATSFRHDDIGWTATEHQSGELYLTSNNLTPEQVIAATLGSDREAELEKLVQDVWAAYSAKAESSFHPAWEVDSELARRMAAFGFKVVER